MIGIRYPNMQVEDVRRRRVNRHVVPNSQQKNIAQIYSLSFLSFTRILPSELHLTYVLFVVLLVDGDRLIGSFFVNVHTLNMFVALRQQLLGARLEALERRPKEIPPTLTPL